MEMFEVYGHICKCREMFVCLWEHLEVYGNVWKSFSISGVDQKQTNLQVK